MNTPATPALLVLVTGSALGVLIAVFIGAFLVPALRQWLRLGAARRRIRRLGPRPATPELARIFGTDAGLAHLWREYQATLHQQRDGHGAVVAERSTVPAQAIFTDDAVVDTRLRTAFFKHLPGLFTGIGIIGTFTGLIQGLGQFQVSEDAQAVRSSLESLMHHVGQAFLVSASAIAAAMVVTLVEKLVLASLYRRNHDIAQAIDARFDPGAGEDYLLRLVQSSEASVGQTQALQASLLTELGGLLRELCGGHTAAMQAQQRQLGVQLQALQHDQQALRGELAHGLREALQEPLRDLARAIQAASAPHAESARGLQEVLGGLGGQLQEMLGTQLAGLGDLNRQTARSVQDAAASLGTLAAGLREDAQGAAAAAQHRLTGAHELAHAREQHLAEQTQTLFAQLHDALAQTQLQGRLQLQSGLDAVAAQVARVLEELGSAQQRAFEIQHTREQAQTQRADQTWSVLTEAIARATQDLAGAAGQLTRSVSTLGEASTVSSERMAAGALTLHAATQDFAAGAQRVGSVMGQAAHVSAQLAESANALTGVASTLQHLTHEHREVGASVAHTAQELRVTVQAARREAALTADVLQRLQSSSERLGTAQMQADGYLASVSQVLVQAHNAFAAAVKGTLDSANTEFHTKLTTSVGLLSAAIEELELTLSTTGTAVALAH